MEGGNLKDVKLNDLGILSNIGELFWPFYVRKRLHDAKRHLIKANYYFNSSESHVNK